MREILIKFYVGYEPQFESYTVHCDDDVCVCGTDEVVGHAIKVPTPHGELKNATHIINELERKLEMEKKVETPFSESSPGNAYMRKCRIEVLEWVIRNIKNQPTVVEASY